MPWAPPVHHRWSRFRLAARPCGRGSNSLALAGSIADIARKYREFGHRRVWRPTSCEALNGRDRHRPEAV